VTVKGLTLLSDWGENWVADEEYGSYVNGLVISTSTGFTAIDVTTKWLCYGLLIYHTTVNTEDVTVTNYQSIDDCRPIYMQRCINSEFTNPDLAARVTGGNLEHNIYASKNNDNVTFTNVTMTGCSAYTMHFYDSSAAEPSTNITINGLHIDSASGAGALFWGVTGLTVTDLTVTGCPAKTAAVILRDINTALFDGFVTNSDPSYAFNALTASVDGVTLQNGTYYEPTLRGNTGYWTNYTESNVNAG
jgi:hypothetical protein